MRIILIGFGTVGQSFVRILMETRSALCSNYGLKPRIVAIADSRGSAIDPNGLDLGLALHIKRERRTIAEYPNKGSSMNGIELIRNVEADLLVEVTPTNVQTGEPGMTHIQEALRRGLHVITTNKGPLVLAMHTLMKLAEDNNALIRFSGAVGGGLPVLEFAEGLKGDEILSIRGILNSTTNYILTQMEEGMEFQEALVKAQNLGYAEADPSLDIDGIDAACKLVILSNLIMNKRFTLKDVSIKGIRGISKEEVQKSLKMGRSIRLISSMDESGMKVEPSEISKEDPIYVRGTLNSVMFKLKYAGDQILKGVGAGGIPTASSILRDMIWIKRAISKR